MLNVSERTIQTIKAVEREAPDLVSLMESGRLKASAAMTEANVTSALAGYRVGSVDFMTLVDAQMTVNQYRQELFALLADYGRMVAELEMAIGRELPATPAVLTEAS